MSETNWLGGQAYRRRRGSAREAAPSNAQAKIRDGQAAMLQLLPAPNPSHGAEPADPMRIWFRFVRLNRRVTSAISAELRTIGLSIPQFDVLSTLSEREGLTQQELAGRLYVTKGNVSGLIDRLVEAGLVERRQSPLDRRSHALHLTADGAILAARGIAAQRAYVARTLGAIDRTCSLHWGRSCCAGATWRGAAAHKKMATATAAT